MLFERLRNKSFWIWNIEDHKIEDSRTKGQCCFNYIIDLQTKERTERARFDYQKILYDTLLIPLNIEEHKKEDYCFNYIVGLLQMENFEKLLLNNNR
jgi:hypothetical protein